MRHVVRICGALIAALWMGHVVSAATSAAQEIKQLKLSDKQVQGFIASQKDLAAIAGKIQAAGDKADEGLQSELEALAKKNGFANFAELDDVAANISIVMAGLDPETGKYSEPLEALKKELEEVKADASIPEADKKQLIQELTEAINTTPELQYKDNIEVVKKHREAIEKAMQ